MIGMIGWVLFILLGLYQVAFSRHMARHVEFLSEYVEFLLQNRVVYADHRAKYAAMLRALAAKSPKMPLREVASTSKRSIDNLAESMHRHAAVSNAMGRARVDDWINAESFHDGLAEKLQDVTN